MAAAAMNWTLIWRSSLTLSWRRSDAGSEQGIGKKEKRSKREKGWWALCAAICWEFHHR